MNKNIIKIGNRSVGPGYPCYIIAEIGSNHDGKYTQAVNLISAAKQSGADAVKFQSFTTAGLLNPQKKDVDGRWVNHPAFPVLQKYSVPAEWHKKLVNYAKQVGITFLSTPFDIPRAKLLESFKVPAYKIASGDLTYLWLIRYIAKLNKPVILSTGAATVNEIKRAIKTVYSMGNKQVALLHCVSHYPSEPKEMNLRVIQTLSNLFRVPVGISDHSLSLNVPIAAVSLGATIIEKHFTLNRNLSGADHGHSLNPEEFKLMVTGIREIEQSLGTGIKVPAESELCERYGARRGVYARVNIPAGAIISNEMVKLVRHQEGIPAELVDKIIGKRSRVMINPNRPIFWKNITKP